MEILTPSDYQSGSKKRPKRQGRPCDACRKRKTRCIVNDGGPKCAYCRLRNSACTYDSTERPTKESRVPVAEHGARQASVPDVSPVEHFPSQARKTATPKAATEASDFVYDRSTLGLAQTRFSELYGLGSDMEPILMVSLRSWSLLLRPRSNLVNRPCKRHRPYNPSTQEFSLDTHAIRRVLQTHPDCVGYPLTFHMVSDEKALEFDVTRSQVDSIEACVRPHGPSLVELFWRHVQPCYPLLHKDFFVQNYRESYRQIHPAILGAVYLSALRWWSYDPELSICPAPDAGSLRKMLHQAISSSYHRPKLSSIQAILLLLQCQPEDPLNPDHTYAWGLTCQALAIGQCLGLNLDPSDWYIPQWEKNVRKRLSWALYMQDRWSALAYGRPVHLHHEDWTVGELSSEDFDDFDNSGLDEERRSLAATGKLQFQLMVRLTQILSSVISSFYTARTSFDQDTVSLYQRSQPLLEELQEWYQAIPLSLQMNITYQRKLCFHGRFTASNY